MKPIKWLENLTASTMKQLSIISNTPCETLPKYETEKLEGPGLKGATELLAKNLPKLCERSSLSLNSAELWGLKTGLTWAEEVNRE